MHGEMSYLARTADVRTDIQRFLPGARSVIVTGDQLLDRPGATARRRRPGAGGALRARRGLSPWSWPSGSTPCWRGCERESGEPFEAAPFVDKHWVQERVFAAYAGLGWIGKHSLRHQPRPRIVAAAGRRSRPRCRSSPTTLVDDQCGACTLCLDACPTGAIVAPREVDARACLSYLTIELDGPVPEPASGRWSADHLYGCDVCQEVCPWNLAPAVSADPAWQPRAGRDHADAAELWQRPDDALARVRRRQRDDARSTGATAPQPGAGDRQRRRRRGAGGARPSGTTG